MLKKRQRKIPLWLKLGIAIAILIAALAVFVFGSNKSQDKQGIESFRAEPFSDAVPFTKVRPLAHPSLVPSGLKPRSIQRAYTAAGFTKPAHEGGDGTIAIIIAYHNPNIEEDLAVFNSEFNLPVCTVANDCLETHQMSEDIPTVSDWAMESALDVQWAHAIAPNAKILLVEASSNSGLDLLDAIDYARARHDVVAISMSWGGNEFADEAAYESHFRSVNRAPFFAASGDTGHGVSWPATSGRVVSVGGTTLKLRSNGKVLSETAWSGSGGGNSKYIPKPLYQKRYKVAKTGGRRAVPDVSYNANPSTGVPIYSSVDYHGFSGWFRVGGTSAGAPQWAAIAAASHDITLTKLYANAKANPKKYFRDITKGTNGACGYMCSALKGYDRVTGLGSPL